MISGLEIDSDLTVINASYDSDETIVGAHTPPAPEEPAKPASVPMFASDTSNLPGSWVESDEVHLQVIEDGIPGQRFELEVSGGDEPDVWEIGRGESCEISPSTPGSGIRRSSR